MVSSINSLANMEYMLYGGASGLNANCPSYLNGYKAGGLGFYGNSPYYGYYNNPYFAQRNNSSSIFNTPNDAYTSSASTSATNFNASAKDLDTLGKYYLKGQAPSESLLGAGIGGAAFGLMTNLRFIAHPLNSFSTIGKVEKTFAGVKQEGSKLNKLWKDPKTHQLMTDAYARMHKLEGASKSRLGMFKSRIDEATYKTLKTEMEAALKSGNAEKIATATEKIRVATNAKTGWAANGWKKIWGSKPTVVKDLINDKAAIKAAVDKNIAEKGSKTIGQYLKKGIKGNGGIGGALMMGIEYLMDAGKIKNAFSKDTSTGIKQLGQTTVKGAGSLAGWVAGEAVGAWAGAKLGAVAGSAVCPGLGTAIGAVAGLVCGSIGCALMGKLTKKLVGDDVGSKVEVENMKKTAQGQAQLLQLTAAQAQEDKKLDPKVLQAIQNVAGRMSA